MDNIEENLTTSQEIEEIDDSDSEISEAENQEGVDLKHEIKTFLRLCRKKLSAYIREKMDKRFTNIVYLTLDCPLYVPNSTRLDSPEEFIEQVRKQYPTSEIRIMIPILGISEEVKSPKKLLLESQSQIFELERTSVKCDFFARNNLWEGFLYKFPQNKENIQVYGVYSQAFSYLNSTEELKNIGYLGAFLRSVRLLLKSLEKDNFKPDIVHSDRIPFYMGAEFETKQGFGPKVLQIIDDFIQPDFKPNGVFWAAINLADKDSMARICKDLTVQKCISRLFSMPAKNFTPKIKECIELIYKNYDNFMEYSKNGEDKKGDFIFKHLDDRIYKLFPNFVKKEAGTYYPVLNSIKRADFWAVFSKSYYKNLFESGITPDIITKQLINTMDKSGYVSAGLNIDNYSTEEGRGVYEHFNSENFRAARLENKKILIKEFGSDRIKTNFIDSKLFRSENIKIYGNLDSFYEAPLLFFESEPDIFGNGIDILFNTILKLFELSKNIQVIISIPDGMKLNFVKTWVNFLSENKAFNGRWVFIDGKINLPKFYAGADMFLIPDRTNKLSIKPLIGMHYGCVPIASEVGYLNDCITDIFDSITKGNGFKTKQSLLKEDDKSDIYINTLLKALDIYKNNHSSWNILIKNCLNNDCGWTFKKIEKYIKIYQEIL